MASFTNAAWSTPRSDLDAGEYCSVCLIDENEPGAEKVKSKCKLPIRKKRGGPIYVNAIRNAMGRIFSLKGVSPNAKRRAARRLITLANQAKVNVSSESLRRLAGS